MTNVKNWIYTLNHNQNIKITEALKRGRHRINMPCVSMVIVFLVVVPLLLAFVFRNDQNNTGLIISGITSVVLGIVLPIIWWLKETVNYKIWAGKHVKDIHRFYEEALSKQFITERRFFKTLEIKSELQKRELNRFFYKRLDEQRVIIPDVNNEIESETTFKSNGISTIIIWIILIAATIYSSYAGYFEDRMVYFIIGAGSLLIIFELYKMYKYSYILKINRDYISYKDDKEKVYWEDIKAFETAKAMQYNPAKLYISTTNGKLTLQLDGIGNIKLNKVLDVLNENKHRFDIKQSVN